MCHSVFFRRQFHIVAILLFQIFSVVARYIEFSVFKWDKSRVFHIFTIHCLTCICSFFTKNAYSFCLIVFAPGNKRGKVTFIFVIFVREQFHDYLTEIGFKFALCIGNIHCGIKHFYIKQCERFLNDLLCFADSV